MWKPMAEAIGWGKKPVATLTLIEPDYLKALAEFKGNSFLLANQLVGASVNSIEELLMLKEHAGIPVRMIRDCPAGSIQ